MIVVVGDIAVDIVSVLRTPLARGSDAPAHVRAMPGGSGANVAVWLARLGRHVAFVGRIGDDWFGGLLAEDLSREGVDARLVVDPGSNTGVIQVLVEPDGERTMVPDRGANARWTESEIAEDLIAGAELLHVVGYVLLDAEGRAGALQAMRYARAHGVPISLDPSSHAPLVAMGPAGFWSLVGRVNILLPNRTEAQVLTGESDAGAGLSALLDRADIVAVKLDRDGCIAGAGSARWQVPAAPVTVANSTGAGDAFDAAFLARWLEDGNIADACRAGVSLGSYAATLPTTR